MAKLPVEVGGAIQAKQTRYTVYALNEHKHSNSILMQLKAEWLCGNLHAGQ